MGATSVTGKGVGASYGGIKGPGNNRNFFVPQITPHIVAAGVVTLSGGTATVTFPTALTGSGSSTTVPKYVVMLTARSATTTLPRVTTLTDTSGNFASFVITGNGTDVIGWTVVTTGVH